MRTSRLLMALALALLARPLAAQSVEAVAALVGGLSLYEVKAGDTLGSIGARFGIGRAALIEINQLARPYALSVGQSLVIDNTHIAIPNPEVSLTLNIAQRMLVFAEGERLRAYPVTVGRRTWPTPVGAFTIVDKEIDPAWDVPVSIQREMAAHGKPVITRMPPGPNNPLGARFLRLSLPNLGIHGTNAPSSIYAFASHGCIRMHPVDVAELFERVSVGMAGVLIYQPVIVAVIDGRLWLEAHPDEYRRFSDPLGHVRDVLEGAGLGVNANWLLVDEVLQQRLGLATDVTSAP